MTISTVDIEIPPVLDVAITEDTLTVELADGRTLSVPLAWYPRLAYASPDERNQWRVIGRGTGIHWQALDEDISIEGLIAGHPSGESQSSLDRWLSSRAQGPSNRSGSEAFAAACRVRTPKEMDDSPPNQNATNHDCGDLPSTSHP